MPEQMTGDEFVRQAKDFQFRSGGGERDVLVYAVGSPERAPRVVWLSRVGSKGTVWPNKCPHY